MQASAYLEDLIVEWMRGSAMPTAPTSLTLALSSAAPGEAGAGLVEPVGGGYARAAITLSAPVSNEVNGSTASNTANVTFSNIPAFTATHMAIFDNSGNMLFHGELLQPRTFAEGDGLTLAATQISVVFRGRFSKYLAEMVINWCRGTAADTAPTGLLLGLSKTAIQRDGTAFTPPLSSQGYEDQVIEFGAPTQAALTGTTITNSSPIIFGPATSTWGTIVSSGIFDDTLTNLLIVGSLSTPRNVASGEGLGLRADTVRLSVQ